MKKTTKKLSATPSLCKPDEKWQIEEDLRTLQRAQEIQKDPKRMAKCKALADEQMNALKDVGK